MNFKLFSSPRLGRGSCTDISRITATASYNTHDDADRSHASSSDISSYGQPFEDGYSEQVCMSHVSVT